MELGGALRIGLKNQHRMTPLSSGACGDLPLPMEGGFGLVSCDDVSNSSHPPGFFSELVGVTIGMYRDSSLRLRMTVSGKKPAADSLQRTTDSGYMLQYRQLQIVFIEGGLAYV